MKALILSCTLKRSPQTSNTEALAGELIAEFKRQDVSSELVRLVDRDILPGVSNDMGAGDEWPAIHQKILQAQIVVIATPTWVGRPSSVAQRALERMDGLITQMIDGRPAAYGKVAGVIVTGNEDGAHHVISECCGGLIDIGFTIPPQAWSYWHKGPGPGEDYLQTDYRHDWSAKTARQAARNLVGVARALQSLEVDYQQ